MYGRLYKRINRSRDVVVGKSRIYRVTAAFEYSQDQGSFSTTFGGVSPWPRVSSPNLVQMFTYTVPATWMLGSTPASISHPAGLGRELASPFGSMWLWPTSWCFLPPRGFLVQPDLVNLTVAVNTGDVDNVTYGFMLLFLSSSSLSSAPPYQLLKF